jgi:adenine specific DNA methylase Mod
MAYLVEMAVRLVELHRVLKETGSLYLHADPTASHYLKAILDGTFGPTNFRTEIIWKRSTAHSDTKQGRKQHGHIHDTILFYTKGDDWTWSPIYTPYDQEYIDRLLQPHRTRNWPSLPIGQPNCSQARRGYLLRVARSSPV